MSAKSRGLGASRGHGWDRGCFHRSATVTNKISWFRFSPCLRASVVDVLPTTRSTLAHDRDEIRRDFRAGRESD